MREARYKGYKCVAVPMLFIDNGDGAGYLRLMFPDGDYVKIFPLDDAETLYDVMQKYLNRPQDKREKAKGGA